MISTITSYADRVLRFYKSDDQGTGAQVSVADPAALETRRRGHRLSGWPLVVPGIPSQLPGNGSISRYAELSRRS